MTSHEMFMWEALRLAVRGRGWTSPNPVVGAVVVRDGQIVGTGYHERYGRAHAEVNALGDAGELARYATLYVTLEPCAHFGKTPPCVDAILKSGVATVVLGARDPNPQAAGGVKKLRAEGLEVVEGVLEQECREQNAPFFKYARTGLPLVSAKWAMTADGKIATARGDSRWITAARTRAFAHELRADHDAVLVGIGTVLMDAPLLTARLAPALEATSWQPRRVILDSRARTPVDAPLWTAAGGGSVIIFVSSSAPEGRIAELRRRGAEVVVVPWAHGGLSIRAVLETLAQRGILSVLVEGGAETLGSFLDDRQVDRAYIFIAPKIIGGRDSVTAVRGRGVDRVSESQDLHAIHTRVFDEDMLIEGRLGVWDWIEPAKEA